MGPLGMYAAEQGLNTAGSFLGGLIGMAFEGHNDRRQLKQQGKLNEQQFELDNRMAEENMRRQMEMWNKTNYAAQVAQLKAANLNPALLYGMSGGGGTTVGHQGGNVSAAKAPSGGGEAMGMALQMGTMDAQRRLLEAQAMKTEKEAENIGEGGIDTRLKEGQILNLAAETDNKEAQTELKKVETNIAKIQERIQGETAEDAIELAHWNVEKAINEVNNLWYEGQIKKGSQESIIQKIKAEAAGALLINELTKAQTRTEGGKPALQQAEIDNIKSEIRTRIRQLVTSEGMRALGHMKNLQDGMNASDEQWIKELSTTTGIATDVIQSVLQAIIFKGIIKGGYKPVEGFKQRY